MSGQLPGCLSILRSERGLPEPIRLYSWQSAVSRGGIMFRRMRSARPWVSCALLITMATLVFRHPSAGLAQGPQPSGTPGPAMLFLWQQSGPPLPSPTPAAPPDNASELKIVVLAGEDGVNIIKNKTAVKPVVEVRDKNNLPVAGAYVAFAGPESGAHVTFAHGSSTYSTVTDASGRATVNLMKPVGAGRFKIKVNASFQGQMATTTIAQTNYLTLAAASAAGAGAAAGAGTAAAAGGISGTMIGVIAGAVAAGVAAGVAVSKSGGGSKTSSTATGSIGSPGSPTLNPPH